MQYTKPKIRIIASGLAPMDLTLALIEWQDSRAMPSIKNSFSALAYSKVWDSPAMLNLRALALGVSSADTPEADRYAAQLDLLACKGLLHASATIGFFWQQFSKDRAAAADLLSELLIAWGTVAPLLGLAVRTQTFASVSHDPRFLNAPLHVAFGHVIAAYGRDELDQYLADQFTMTIARFGDLLDLDLLGGAIEKLYGESHE